MKIRLIKLVNLIKQDRAWNMAQGWMALIAALLLIRWIWRLYSPPNPALWAEEEARAIAALNRVDASLKATGSSGAFQDGELNIFLYSLFGPVIWLFVYGMLYFIQQASAEPWRRVTPFLMALPVSRRELLAARLISLTISVWACFSAAYLIFDLLQGHPWTPAWALLGFPAAATLEMAAHHCTHIRQEKGTSWLVPGAWAAALFTLWHYRVANSILVIIYPVALLLGAIGLVVTAWKTIPPVFARVAEGKWPVERLYRWALGSIEAAQPEVADSAPSFSPDLPDLPVIAPSDNTKHTRRPVRRLVIMALLRHSTWVIVWLGLMFLQGLLGGMQQGSFWYFLVPCQASTMITIFANMGRAPGKYSSYAFMRWLSALPIPPRNPLRLVMALILVFTLSGYCLVSLFGPEEGQALRVSTAQKWGERGNNAPTAVCPTLNVAPPLEFWKPVKGQPPAILSPWGEEFQPSASNVLGINVYNPFAVGCGNTKRFFDWQIERATLAVYGRSIPYEPDRWFLGARPGVGYLIVNVAFFVAVLLLVGIGAAFDQWRRVRIVPRWLRRILSGVISLGVPLGVYLFVIVKDGFRAAANNNPLIRIVWILPENLYLVIAIAGVTVAALYWVFDRVSREMDAPLTTSPEKA